MRLLDKLFRYRGGVSIDDRKELSSNSPLEYPPRPSRLVLSMSQHIGTPAVPCVAPGEHVKKFQKIADASGPVSSPVHAPFSGVVKEIANIPTASSRVADAVVIDLDPAGDAVDSTLAPMPNWRELPDADLLARIRDAGVVGAGGAGFPTFLKLSRREDKPVDTVIVNGVECEPYLNGDNRLMIEGTRQLWEGASIIRRVTGASRIVIAVEENKPGAIAALESALRDTDCEIAVLPKVYPQGSEKHVIYSVTGRVVKTGTLPLDVGCVVENVWTVLTIYKAVVLGEPVTVRTVTVSGDAVMRSANFAAPVGILVSDLVAAVGGFRKSVSKAICGGPMMGMAMPSLDLPITKTCSGLVFLSEEETFQYSSSPCINCGRCVDACPMGLMPSEIAKAVEADDIPFAEKLHVTNCFECGSCAFVCPARRPLVQHNRRAKAIIAARRKAASRPIEPSKEAR